MVGNKYKLLSMDNGESFQLYDILHDQGETTDLSDKFPEIKSEMKKQLNDWSLSLD